MAEKIMLGKKNGDEKGMSIDITYNNVATLHHSFIGLMERMWKAVKHSDKAPFKYMGLPTIDLSDFKMKIIEGVEAKCVDQGDVTIVRFYVRNIFDDNIKQQWLPFRELTLSSFLPYEDGEKHGRYDRSDIWGWFRKIALKYHEEYRWLYDQASFLTWFFNGCAEDFLTNNICADIDKEECDAEVDDE